MNQKDKLAHTVAQKLPVRLSALTFICAISITGLAQAHTITIKKVAVAAPGSTLPAQIPAFSFAGSCSPGVSKCISSTFNVTANDSTGKVFSSSGNPAITTGTHVVTESTPSTGWKLTKVECNDGGDGAGGTTITTDLQNSKATINLTTSGAAVCTFTNTYDVAITTPPSTSSVPGITEWGLIGTASLLAALGARRRGKQ